MDPRFEKLFIFEMANNHQGSLRHGMEIIRILGEVTRRFDINAAVKFQYRELDTMIHPDYRDRTDVKHISRFLSTRLTDDEFYTMVKAVKEEGMLAMCTPFDEISVDTCMDHGIDIIKVASCSATDWPLLEKVALSKRPVIVSTGGKTFSEMDKIYNFFTHRDVDLAMLHCVGLYPVGYGYVQLDCMDKIKDRYPDVAFGYSGHEDPEDLSIAMMAAAKGASILERHVGLATEGIVLNAYSTDVREIDKWVGAVIKARQICGSTEKYISNDERRSMDELARGCYVKRSLKAGQAIKREDVFFAMPCADGQMKSGDFIDGITATKDYELNGAIFETRTVSVVADTRSIIHDVKGMLYEARIPVGSAFELELSHHYGIGHFRHYGVTIINIINREYCKKILVVLPGQQHPCHSHKVKEESFQILYGSMLLRLNGEERELKAGEVVTVKRGDKHSWTSVHGCIFEEISTTHERNDSYYEDEKIAKMDPMERKTILTDW